MTNLSGNISSACAREIPIISVHGWFSTVRMKGSHRTGRLKQSTKMRAGRRQNGPQCWSMDTVKVKGSQESFDLGWCQYDLRP